MLTKKIKVLNKKMFGGIFFMRFVNVKQKIQMLKSRWINLIKQSLP